VNCLHPSGFRRGVSFWNGFSSVGPSYRGHDREPFGTIGKSRFVPNPSSTSILLVLCPFPFQPGYWVSCSAVGKEKKWVCHRNRDHAVPVLPWGFVSRSSPQSGGSGIGRPPCQESDSTVERCRCPFPAWDPAHGCQLETYWYRTRSCGG
jgi:hypothetical protein